VLRESETRYRSLFENMINGFAYHRVIQDEGGKPADYVFLEVNEAFEKLTRLNGAEIIGKRVTEVLPGIEEDPADWIGTYGRVALTGEGIRFEQLSRLLGAWYSVSVYSPLKGYLVAVFEDITIRKQAEERLQTSLHEKEVLLKEIHHRVKNNIQVISSLVGLQADVSTDETVREVLKDVTSRVRSMALVHEKLYQTADLSSIDLAEYAKSLLNYLWRAHSSAATSVRLTLDLEPLSLPVDTAVPCGLILNELAGNALKHAFRGRSEGEVTVSLQGTPEGRVSLCLRDNGVGMPEELEWRQTSSLGLRLVQMLAGQLNATVEVSSHSGTEFTVSFSLKTEG